MKHSLPTEAGQTEPSDSRAQRIDAINQVFALFRLNYHAQFFKAYTTEAELTQIKKLWLGELARYKPHTLLRAAKAIIESSDYLPTLHTMIRQCDAVSDNNLPDAHTAYIEACRAPSPKAFYTWSHPAIYHAGKACDWYFLQTSSEAIAYPVFRKKYQDICQRIRAGEDLTISPHEAIESDTQQPLSKIENQAKLKSLRETLDL